MEDLEFQNVGSGEGAVERFVRSLIADNQLSLARNIVESLGEEYNYLKFEIELKAGNFRRALEIFQVLPDAQKKPYVFVAESLEKGSSDVSESIERIVRDLYNENYPLVLTELQRIKRDHPQVVEAIALELIASVKRGDKRRAKSLADVLRKLDKTHPALAQVRATQDLNSLLVPAVLLAVLALVLINLALSVLSTSRPSVVDTSRIELNLRTMNTSLETVNQLVSVINSKLSSLESSLIAERDSKNATLTNIEEKFKSIEEYMKFINRELSTLERLRSAVQTSSGATRQVVVQGKNVDAELATLKNLVGSISSRLNEVLTRLKNTASTSTPGVTSTELEILERHQRMLEEINRKLEELSSAPQVPITGVPLPTFGRVQENMTTWVTQRTVDARTEPALSVAHLESMVIEQRAKLQNALKKIDELSKAIGEMGQTVPTGQVETKVDSERAVEPIEALSLQEINELRVSVSSLAAKVEELAQSLKEQRVDSSTVTQKATDVRLEPVLSSAQLKSMVIDQRAKLQSALKKIDELSKAIGEISKSAISGQVRTGIDTDRTVEANQMLSSQEINELKVSVSSLAAKVEELAQLVKKQRVSNESDALSEAVARLKSEFGREIGTLKEAINSLSQDLQRMRSNVEERITQISERVQPARTPAPVSTTEDVTKIINETKDLRELYTIGLRYFSNGFLEQAEKVFSHLEDRLEGLDVYFTEDVYYFLILTYIRLGKNAAARQAFERYKSSYPNGDYIRELQSYLK